MLLSDDERRLALWVLRGVSWHFDLPSDRDLCCALSWFATGEQRQRYGDDAAGHGWLAERLVRHRSDLALGIDYTSGAVPV